VWRGDLSSHLDRNGTSPLPLREGKLRNHSIASIPHKAPLTDWSLSSLFMDHGFVVRRHRKSLFCGSLTFRLSRCGSFRPSTLPRYPVTKNDASTFPRKSLLRSLVGSSSSFQIRAVSVIRSTSPQNNFLKHSRSPRPVATPTIHQISTMVQSVTQVLPPRYVSRIDPPFPPFQRESLGSKLRARSDSRS
jgi:hypothetical protein